MFDSNFEAIALRKSDFALVSTDLLFFLSLKFLKVFFFLYEIIRDFFFTVFLELSALIVYLLRIFVMALVLSLMIWSKLV